MIFINYRKNDTQTTVDHLADRLKGAFGPENVFKDDSNLQGGDRWLARLRAELSRARVLVAVIGPNWLKAADDHGRRRLDDPNDWVRVEICTALRDGKPVVVVLADGAAVPPAAGLPTGCELEQLSDIQNVDLRKGAGRDQDLKDLIQLLARLTELPVRPPADQAAAADVTPLPPAPAVFFGRDDVLATLRSQVIPADPGRPLPKVPVTGIGGMGKSTLTAALLHDPAVVERYADRRHFAKLDGADGLPLLLEKLAGALGVPLGAGLTNRIVSASGAGGPRLLVLDNLETPLRDEGQQSEVLEFLEQLAAVPALAVVASLRPGCPLGAGWKRPLELLPYDLAAARDTFHARSSEIYLDDPDLDGLLTELDGWPIAVTVLARRAGEYPRAKDLADAWREQHSALLVSGSSRRDADLGACVGLSLAHPRMNDAAKRLLGLLALSPDGIDQDDMNELLPGKGNSAAATLRAVGGLTTDEYYRLKDRDRPRMWMPAPLRDYIGTRFPASADDQSRWVRLYCRRANKLAGMIGEAKAGEAIDRMRAEGGNMAEAVRLGLAGNTGLVASMSALAMSEYGMFQGIDFRSLLTQVLAVARRWPESPVYFTCLLSLGRIAGARGDVDEAATWFQRCGIAITELQTRLSSRRATLGRHQRREVGMAHDVGIAISRALYEKCAGDLAFDRSDYPVARAHFDRALELYQQGGAGTGLAQVYRAQVYRSLGRLATERAEYAEALEFYERASRVSEGEGWAIATGNNTRGVADVMFYQGEFADAARGYREALALHKQGGDLFGEANCVRGLGEVDLAQGRWDDADTRFEQAIEISNKLKNYRISGDILISMGDLATARNRPVDARGHYDRALRAFRHIRARKRIGEIHQRLARIAADSAKRAEHVCLARANWKPLDLPPEFLNELDDEFGPEPAADAAPPTGV